MILSEALRMRRIIPNRYSIRLAVLGSVGWTSLDSGVGGSLDRADSRM
jgi:hypothetical protein